MAKKIMAFKTKGMNRDLSVSAFSSEFAYENLNLRLATSENNTMLSWVSEKGTSAFVISSMKNYKGDTISTAIEGIAIGTAVLNHKLIIFTHKGANEAKPDIIYCIEKDSNGNFIGTRLFKGNIGLNTKYPLETLVAYEADNIQKVYWVDGLNQPRFINIAANSDKLKIWNESNTTFDYFFDFVPAYSMTDKVNIELNVSSGGLFSPGTIQYCFTYINKNGQQSNIVYLSTLYYLAHTNRGASPEDKVTSSFKIEIKDIDTTFDYIRLYSIHRTSINGTPEVKLLNDIPILGEYAPIKIEKKFIYSTLKSYTLPVDQYTFGRILSMEVANATYYLDYGDSTAIKSFSNTATVNILGVLNIQTMATTQLMTLQELISRLVNTRWFAQQGISITPEYKSDEYYAYFKVTQSLITALNQIANKKASTSNSWVLSIDDTNYTTNNLLNKYVIYDYASGTWEIRESLPTVTVTPSTENHSYITYVDNGTTGTILDPTELLFVGGKEISALTMADKDNTLFLGNITQKNAVIDSIQDYFDDKRDEETSLISFNNNDSSKTISIENHNSFYGHTNTLSKNLREISTFKGGETYRFGIQLQKRNGEWSDPIFIDDVINTKYPNTDINTSIINLISANATLNISEIAAAYDDSIEDGEDSFYSVFKKVRPVIVHPNIGDRSVLCQGVINPTLFNIEDRLDSSPFAQASWFFRPYNNGAEYNFDPTSVGTTVSSSESMSAQEANTYIANNINDIVKHNYYDVYVLIANVTSEELGEIVANKGIKYCVSEFNDELRPDIETEHSVDVDGMIILKSNTTTITCAFFSKNKWQKEQNNIGETEPHSGDIANLYYKGIGENDHIIGNVAFRMYNKIQIASNLQYYYSKNNSDTGENTYSFYFYVDSVNNKVSLYTAVFADTEAPKATSEEYRGNILNFKHYQSICSTPPLGSRTSTKFLPVEIQGSEDVYESPYEESKATTAKSNTQFFIDQSIVTLNSPDIDFDTEVQSYGNEGLKLRVIGAIPLTATASSHSIKASSSMLETNSEDTNAEHKFGIGEVGTNIIRKNKNTTAYRRQISDFLWNDVFVTITTEGSTNKVKTGRTITDFMVYPWQRIGSLNNDVRAKESVENDTNVYASSWLEYKRMANLWYSFNTEYFSCHSLDSVNFEHVSTQVALTENSDIINYRMPKQRYASSTINYYPNIDKVLVNSNGYGFVDRNGSYTDKSVKTTNPIPVKYKSTSHFVVALNAENNTSSAGKEESKIPIMPYGKISDTDSIGKYDNPKGNENITFWGDNDLFFKQNAVDINNLFNGVRYGYLWLGELYKDVPNESRFGGKSKTAILSNNWLIAGDDVAISSNSQSINLKWTEGDTFYQRYDCLKTYPFTEEDTNQIVEILSFMCETRVNIDGRYDKNRGQLNNTLMRPYNFNLFNPVYSQENNFFTSKKVDTNGLKTLSYPNHAYYSKTKQSGADVDLWTNVTLGSTMEFDGDKGEIKAIRRLNDALIAFQDSGISQILYNENVQISTEQGVPIEIANSGKVQGKRYISNTIGCSNKWSIVTTPTGIYFIDSNDKSIYLFNGQLNNLSTSLGFNTWAKQNIPSMLKTWNPVNFDNFTTQYDKRNQEVLFINKNTALAYSEKFNCFTSFYNYEKSSYLCNLDDLEIWIRSNAITLASSLYTHQTGDYCNFFGAKKPFSMTFIANENPFVNKIFTNIEFNAGVDGDLKTPFDSIEVWNEYQKGIGTLSTSEKLHHTNSTSPLTRKFRLWRCDIPRDNADISDTDATLLNVTRFAKHPMDRMKNPWLYIKLKKNPTASDTIDRTEIHDLLVTYFD